MEILFSFLEYLIDFVCSFNFNFSNWVKQFENELVREEWFSNWVDKLKSFTVPDIKIQNTSRTIWKEDEKEFHLKINRFGHAIDPERGMLAYYGLICENTIAKMLFDKKNTAWYKDTPNEVRINSYLNKYGLETKSDFLNCFLLGSGLNTNKKFLNLINEFIDIDSDSIEIDLSKFLEEDFFTLNKSLRTIFKFSKQFHIIDSMDNIRIKFVWNNFNVVNDFSKFPSITPIQNKTSFDEDDITYITVHNVLRHNNYKLIAVSYPGAQGDRVVLAEAGTGRRQQRRYIDIISYLPESHTALQENKGKFSPKSIQVDINEFSKYKDEITYKQSIDQFLNRFDEDAPKVFKIGVGFWANNRFTIKNIQQLEIDKLDYFIYIISDKTRWKVFCTGNIMLFTITEGNIELPEVYEVKDKTVNQLGFFEE